MPRASVLVVDDEDLICWSLEKDLTRQGYAVSTAANAALAVERFEKNPADVVLLDINLPDRSGLQLIAQLHAIREDAVIVMITSTTSLETAVEAVRLGAWDYVTKPFDFPKLYNSVAKAAERVALKNENRALKVRDSRVVPPRLIAESPAMKNVLMLAERVSSSDGATVLLMGESGVGKDLLARHIHDSGARAEGIFLDINCAALPETLLESELFGYERGAFTDAKVQKLGLLELAAAGTVYLDEVADAPLGVQAKLLKVLEQRTFRRLGGTRDLTADVRLIAATNRDLERAVEAQTLRKDLYYRLKVFPILIPPLRERREDILPMARAFVGTYARAFHKQVEGLKPEAEQRLRDYAWPGNVRELRNIIERALILATDETELGLELLPPELAEDVAGHEGHGALADTEARLIREALSANAGNQSRAAAQLGISRGALARRMRRMKISAD